MCISNDFLCAKVIYLKMGSVFKGGITELSRPGFNPDLVIFIVDICLEYFENLTKNIISRSWFLQHRF